MTAPSPSPHLAGDRLVAVQGGSDPSEDEAIHLLDCPSCSARVEDVSDARGSPPMVLLWNPSCPVDLAGLEVRLLAAAAGARRAPRASPFRVAVGACLVAAAALAVVAADLTERARPAPPPSHATILLAPAGSVSQMQTGGDEVWSLRGEATISVGKMRDGERFRVRIGADEAEVRGTRFTLREADGGLAEVRVQEGTVEVRAACCPTATLHAGAVWSRPASPGLDDGARPALNGSAGAAPDTSAEAPPPAAPRSADGAPSPASPSPAPGPSGSATELLAQGTAAYDAGRFASAGGLLTKAASAEPHAAWARDAATLGGSARVLSTPIEAVPTLSVSVASFDTAAARARRQGDARLASAAALGAARHLTGKTASARFCALKNDGALSSAQRAEADAKCAR